MSQQMRARYVDIEVLGGPDEDGVMRVRTHGEVIFLPAYLIEQAYVQVFTTTADEIEEAG